ncbi:MAG TPA: hypothetical protein VF170_13395 [Planctomycetaceae bacterium]
MSPRGSSPKPAPEPGIYDGLLVVSCAALLAGIIFLVLHLQNYDWQVG